MKQFGYFEKLSLAARWFLKHEEAQALIEDYQDILSEMSGPEEMREHFGPPWKPVLELVDKKKIRRWNLSFSVLVFCALVPFLVIIWQGAGYNYDFFLRSAGDVLLCGVVYLFGLDVIFRGSNSRTVTWFSVGILTVTGVLIFLLHPVEALGNFMDTIERAIFKTHFFDFFNLEYWVIISSIVSFLYYGLGKKNRKPLPGVFRGSIFAAVFMIVCIYGFVMYCFYIDFVPMLHAFRMKFLCEVMAAVFFLGAFIGIVMAKMFDSRWRSVYILCMTGMVLCYAVQSVWSNMNPSFWMQYDTGVSPSPEAIQEGALFFTWDLALGGILAVIGLL